MKKQSGWLSAIAVVAFLLLRIASMSMQHPEWNANDWIAVAGFSLLVGAVVYGGVWLVKKMRAPKTATAEGMSFSVPANVQMNASQLVAPTPVPAPAPEVAPSTTCRQCRTTIEPGSNFCTECGTAA